MQTPRRVNHSTAECHRPIRTLKQAHDLPSASHPRAMPAKSAETLAIRIADLADLLKGDDGSVGAPRTLTCEWPAKVSTGEVRKVDYEIGAPHGRFCS